MPTNGKPSALLLAPECPYPLVGGGAQRIGSVLHFLAQHYSVDAIFFREAGGPSPSDHLPEGLIRRMRVIDLPFHSRHATSRIWRNAKRLIRRSPPLIDRFSGFQAEVQAELQGRKYDVAVIEHFWCAPYIEQVAPHCQTTVLNLHNVESVWHDRCAEVTERSKDPSGMPMGAVHRVFRDACLTLERTYLPQFSMLLATSDCDAEHVRRIVPGAPVVVYPNTIPPIAQPSMLERDEVVLSGTFDYEPNRVAVRFFRQNIWPRLRERWPNLIWRLVGRNACSVQSYVQDDARIVCSGPVPDAVTELAAAKVAIVPLLSGSGTRLKIIEAWAAARPVVSTRLGAEGLPVVDGKNVILADTAADFCSAVSALLESQELRESIGRAGREVYERSFTWNNAWEILHTALQRP